MILLAAGMVAGCSSSQMGRIERNRALYETWPIDIRQAVLDGKVEPGMTPDMVKVAWGEPTEIIQQSNTGDEIWVYKKGGYDPAMSSGTMGGTGMGGTVGVMTGGGGGTRGIYGVGGGIGGGIGGGVGGGMGGGMGGVGGMGGPPTLPPTPPEIREVVFRNGVVHRADAP